ncbi:pyruvate dehydrogenase (acetyl-transferring) E1 component subunit alpha [Candidatus Marsarchaeota archaeon]|jgi:pyruvate dehydrogenase E1 component alpha subunit|nr:pyruvate dehydrogenase (acetyl-transferring) E1 component subunit alpha [Candidatus Marsarchaeota archaeon]MCL5090350.1 pyruvate dehydrogenase (acetyl-transferring) E1 component subunit alpha [Candidatus Marsarchaeota archaeon]
MQKQVFEGYVEYLQIMDEDGNIDEKLMPAELSDEKIIDMYKYMLFARNLDAKTLSLQRQGRVYTFAPLLGEEATQIGVAFAMKKDDILVPSFRQHGIFLARGLPLASHFIYWKGYEEGNITLKGINSTPFAVPVSTQMPHAAGIAFGQKYQGKNASVVAYIGDGGTSEGDFYESINFAGVYKLSLVTIIENNQWAISMPRSGQTAAQTLAQKAVAAGIDCIQVDGNDVIAVYKAASDAIKSRNPALIECVTYRLGMHTTSDDPTKYRTDEEVKKWEQKDPIKRVKAYLEKKNLWNDKLESDEIQSQMDRINKAVEEAESFKPDPVSMFKNVYSFMPEIISEEMESAVGANFWL